MHNGININRSVLCTFSYQWFVSCLNYPACISKYMRCKRMLGMLLSSNGHDFRANFDIKWEYVIKQNHTSVNLLFMVCVKTVTNDTVKGTGFATVRWRCIFAQNIGLQVPHSGVCKTHYSFHNQIHSCQLPKSREIIIAWLQKTLFEQSQMLCYRN